MSAGKDGPSFWHTLPGIITAVAGLVGASAALLTALHTTGVIGQGENNGEPSAPAESRVDPEPVAEPPSTGMNGKGEENGEPSAPAEDRADPEPVVVPPSPVPSPVDRTDARETAAAVLKAYAARDLRALAGLSKEGNRQIFKELAAQGEDHPRYRSIFSGWRFGGVQMWDGEIGEARYGRDRARVKFGEISPDEIIVVTLDWENGKWCFEDIHSPTPETFYSGASRFDPDPER